jgi:hypothetical protein
MEARHSYWSFDIVDGEGAPDTSQRLTLRVGGTGLTIVRV